MYFKLDVLGHGFNSSTLADEKFKSCLGSIMMGFEGCLCYRKQVSKRGWGRGGGRALKMTDSPTLWDPAQNVPKPEGSIWFVWFGLVLFCLRHGLAVQPNLNLSSQSSCFSLSYVGLPAYPACTVLLLSLVSCIYLCHNILCKTLIM